MPDAPETIADDSLEGVKAISDFLGLEKRRTQYLIDAKLLPVGKLGRRIYGSKRVLREHWQKLTSGNVPAATK